MSMFSYTSGIVQVGNVAIGGNNPIRIQSMTSTNTLDTEATVAQAIRLIEAGCELVRITAPGEKEALALETIQKKIREKGFSTPLIADIHYKPKAAEIAARIVDKVRINPGNYVDRKKGRTHFSKTEYDLEIEKIRSNIKPLIEICKTHGTAMRIGSNHGSLSERILLEYGDTPEGMVQSAMEFIEICESFSYHDIILSMKASNVKVMVEANRLLIEKMMNRGMNYPLHLGVTEAGDAEDGRMKSAAGIGTLLYDGIGDTIRVSLTEEPENEIPVARQLALKPNLVRQIKSNDNQSQITIPQRSFDRHETSAVGNIGGDHPPVVIIGVKKEEKPNFNIDFKPDFIFDRLTGKLFSEKRDLTLTPVFINSDKTFSNEIRDPAPEKVFVIDLGYSAGLNQIKGWFEVLKQKKLKNPVILHKDFGYLDEETLIIKAAADFGYFLIDGMGDGIWLKSLMMQPEKLAEIAFGVLQATRSRITKTEYIACPSCGRTLFNIQQTLSKIKEKTSQFKNLKIGVMGCCVNGPGEMADADFGYVGAGKGKVTLYKGKKIMETGVPEEDAVDKLLTLINSEQAK
ncbi:MAG: (E)-4-hydroxy-3-methylbut-2-enyl-diphosphate synthase [Bacteroidales bacterium]|nr:(E)-4-hydroxy-3-methylbut-2-enyl-diphosphate synthase [Bacteroidales bacterium]